MRFIAFKARTISGSDSLKTIARPAEKYESDLVAMQQVRWNKIDSGPTDIFLWKWELSNTMPITGCGGI